MRGPLPWLKPAVFTGALVPLAALVIRAARGTLSADPIAEILNQFGLLALIFLIATLALTPLRKLTGWPWPIRIRRTVGLFAFFYACLHFTTYVAVDQSFHLHSILDDIVKRKFQEDQRSEERFYGRQTRTLKRSTDFSTKNS